MSTTLQVWLLLAVGFAAANLPFLTERLLLVGPRLARKALGWRLLELLLLGTATVVLGQLIEAHIGQRQDQRWEFYVAAACLFVTFAFPGFVWRYLRRQAPPVTGTEPASR
ncbi:MAG: DUF2818 family protein [Burkholderiales bacterium]|nr:DUF2818 family protein [Burkholderiales bacterium]